MKRPIKTTRAMLNVALFESDPVKHSACCLDRPFRSEEHTSELQSQSNLVCRLLPEKQRSYKTRRTHVDDHQLITAMERPLRPSSLSPVNRQYSANRHRLSPLVLERKRVPLLPHDHH